MNVNEEAFNDETLGLLPRIVPRLSVYCETLTSEQQRAVTGILMYKGDIDSAAKESGIERRVVEAAKSNFIDFVKSNATDIKNQLGRTMDGIVHQSPEDANWYRRVIEEFYTIVGINQ